MKLVQQSRSDVTLNPVWLQGNHGLNSFEVFMEFVDWTEDSKVLSTDRLFSVECYQKWVSSRVKLPKDPESSFRRALIGHVTGNERRRPFPADVEEHLLVSLRRRRVWDCFKGPNSKPVGERGFRKYGHHEMLKQRGTPAEATYEGIYNEEEAVDTPEIDLVNPVPARSFPCDSAAVSFESQTQLPQVNCVYTVIRTQNPTNGYVLSTACIPKPYIRAITELKKGVPCCQSQSDYDVCDKIIKLVMLSSKPWTPAGKFANELVYNLHPSLVFSFLRGYEISKSRDPSIDMLGSLFYNKLNMNPDDDPRLKRSFVLAHPGFDLRKPIGTLLTDISGGHVIKMAHLDKEILGENVAMKVWTALQSPIQMAVRWVHAFPVAMTTGESWSHVEVKLSNGKRKILLACSKYSLKYRNYAVVKFQDVSEHYGHILALGELY